MSEPTIEMLKAVIAGKDETISALKEVISQLTKKAQLHWYVTKEQCYMMERFKMSEPTIEMLKAVIAGKDETISALKEVISQLTKKAQPDFVAELKDTAHDNKIAPAKYPPIFDESCNDGRGGYRKMTDDEKIDFIGTFREITGVELSS